MGASFSPGPNALMIETLNDYLSTYGPGKEVKFRLGEKQLFLREVGDIDSEEIIFELVEF